MDFSYILSSAVPRFETFSTFGFTKTEDGYVCRKKLLSSDFYVIIHADANSINAEVFDSATGEKYVLFDMPNVNGSFVASIRSEVQDIINSFREKCFVSEDITKKYLDFLEKEFGCLPEYPWENDQACVFRCNNNKWFALIMKVKYRQLGIQGDDFVNAVNLKADCTKIPELIDRKTVFPAWHMNKKYWITVLLSAVTDFELLCRLTEESRELAGEGKNTLDTKKKKLLENKQDTI